MRNFSILILFITIFLFSQSIVCFALESSFIDYAFDKLNAIDQKLKLDAIDLLKSYFYDANSLESLKNDLPDILSLFLGENYEEKLNEKGLTMEEIFSEIDELKTWSKNDRMELLDKIQKSDKEGVKRLIEKYQSVDSPSIATNQIPVQQQQQQQVEITVKFNDIEKHWAKAFIEFCARKGIVKGKREGYFVPDDKVTRAEFTAMLSRLLNLELKEQNEIFRDVKKDNWFFGDVMKAYSAGIVKGNGELFLPNNNITREEMIVMTMRALSYKNKSTFIDSQEEENILNKFKDKKDISTWARTEIAISVKLGVSKGIKEDLYLPKKEATRAEAATVIYNMYHIIYGN